MCLWGWEVRYYYFANEVDVRCWNISWSSPSLQPNKSRDLRLWNVFISSIRSCKSGNLQKWKWDKKHCNLWPINLRECGDTDSSTITYLFRRQSDPSTICPYASLNNCRALGEISVFENTRFSSAAAKSLSPICSGKPTRESTWWMLSATNNRVRSKSDFVVYLRLPSAL